MEDLLQGEKPNKKLGNYHFWKFLREPHMEFNLVDEQMDFFHVVLLILLIGWLLDFGRKEYETIGSY
jgi:hypothetical protein